MVDTKGTERKRRSRLCRAGDHSECLVNYCRAAKDQWLRNDALCVRFAIMEELQARGIDPREMLPDYDDIAVLTDLDIDRLHRLQASRAVRLYLDGPYAE